MAESSSIEWTDATWNIVTGCDVVSPGCTNCYAMKLAGTRLKRHPSRKGLTRPSKAGPVWTGEVRFNEGWLDQPLRWKRPRMIFVAAHGDLFHEGVSDDQLDRVFAVMALAPQHTFQVLTKRPERMRDYVTGLLARNRAERKADNDLGFIMDDVAYRVEGSYDRSKRQPVWAAYARTLWTETTPGSVENMIPPELDLEQPLPNVWLGVSVEDQKRADRFRRHNNDLMIETPLIDQGLSKSECFALLDRAGIRLPLPYALGFANNNCLPCVKAEGAAYWNRIRRHFPERFARMAALERELGYALVRVRKGGKKVPVFLDELPLDSGDKDNEPEFECGITCYLAEQDFEGVS